MNDLKLFDKNEDQLESLLHIVRVFSSDIKMDFGFSKYALLLMKRGTVAHRDGSLMPNGDMMKCVEEGKEHNYFGLLEVDEIKHEEKENYKKTHEQCR